MKPRKLTSVMLSLVIGLSMVATPVGVVADETSAPSETQSVEPTEKETTKAIEKPETEETTKPSDDETKDKASEDKTRETTEPTEEKISETPKEPSKEITPEASEERQPAETEKKVSDPTEEGAHEENKEKETGVPEESKEATAKGKIPGQQIKSKAQKEGNTSLSGRYDIAVVWTYENGTITFNKSFDTENPTYILNEGNIQVSIGDAVIDSDYEEDYELLMTCFGDATNCVIGEGIEYIGQWLFEGHKHLESITIAKSVTGVDWWAFCNCPKLKTVTITKELYDEIVLKPRNSIGFSLDVERFDNYGKDIHFIFSTQAANPLSVKGKTATVKYKKLRKKNQYLSVSKVISFTKKGQGKMSYAKVSGNKKILINKSTGKVTVKKKLKKGNYKVKVKVMAAGNDQYKPSAWKTVTFRIKVK